MLGPPSELAAAGGGGTADERAADPSSVQFAAIRGDGSVVSWPCGTRKSEPRGFGLGFPFPL